MLAAAEALERITPLWSLLSIINTLLVIAGALNGLILPLSLGISRGAAKSKKIVGADYKHPWWLFILGVIVVILSAYVGIKSLGNLGSLFH